MNEQSQSPVPQSDVQSPPVQTPVTPAVEESKESSSSFLKYLLIVFAGLLLVAATAGITYWFMSRDESPVVDETVVEEEDTVTEVVDDSDVNEEDADDVSEETVDSYEGWLTLDNEIGYTIKYPSSLDVVTPPESQLGDSIDPESSYYVMFRPFSDHNTGTTTFFSVAYQNRNTVSDINYQMVSFDSAEEFAQILLETNQANPYTYVSTEEGVHQIEFDGRTAYEFSIVSKGFHGPYERGVSGEGTISAVVFEENGYYYCIYYYEVEPYINMIESFTLE